MKFTVAVVYVADVLVLEAFALAVVVGGVAGDGAPSKIEGSEGAVGMWDVGC
jgi:hypothetical protein